MNHGYSASVVGTLTAGGNQSWRRVTQDFYALPGHVVALGAIVEPGNRSVFEAVGFAVTAKDDDFFPVRPVCTENPARLPAAA